MNDTRTYETETNSCTDYSTDLAARLADAGLRTDRAHRLVPGAKNPRESGYTEGIRPVGDMTGDYGVATGLPNDDGEWLAVVDIDTYDGHPPEWVRELPATFVVRSPHGGKHHYLAVRGDTLRSRSPSWGEFQARDQQMVGPGSSIDHAKCSENKPCDGTGIGTYRVVSNREIATVTTEWLTETVPGVRRESSDGDDDTTDEQGETSRPPVSWFEPDVDPDEVTNALGMSLSDVCAVSYRLHRLRYLLNPGVRYESNSDADMNTVYLLRGWHFSEDDTERILRALRDREGRDRNKPKKMQRDDYAPGLVDAAKGRVDPIDPPLAHSLVKSARENSGHGPKASRRTLDVVHGHLVNACVEAWPDDVPTRAVADRVSLVSDRQVRRALHILGDAGYITRWNTSTGYRWGLTDAPVNPWIVVTEATDDGSERIVRIGATGRVEPVAAD